MRRINRLACYSALLGIAALGIAASAPAAAKDQSPLVSPADLSAPQWSRYLDPKSGTAVDYPTSVFSVEDGAPEIGWGKRLRTQDARAQLSIYALSNEEGYTPRSYLQDKLKFSQRDLEYARVTGRFFAISGVRDERVYYSRCNFSPKPNDAIHCIYMEYPEVETKAWDDIVTRISRSLHSDRDLAVR